MGARSPHIITVFLRQVRHTTAVSCVAGEACVRYITLCECETMNVKHECNVCEVLPFTYLSVRWYVLVCCECNACGVFVSLLFC